jgi:hypothetical protein
VNLSFLVLVHLLAKEATYDLRDITNISLKSAYEIRVSNCVLGIWLPYDFDVKLTYFFLLDDFMKIIKEKVTS